MNTRATVSAPLNESEDLHRRILLSGSIGIAIAAVATVLRLVARLWRRVRLAWDDALAILAMLLLILTGVVGKVYYSVNERSTLPQHRRVALYYIFAISFDLVIWTSRLSILATIMMLGFYKRILQAMAVLFVVAVTFLVTQVLWVCEPQHKINHWKNAPHPQCSLGDGVGIAQVTTDVFADIVLVVSPLLILRHLKSQEAKAERVRLSVSFIVGGLTTIVSIVHAYYLFNSDLVSIIVGNVELSVSVIICNFTVLAAALHRLWNQYVSPPQDRRKQEQATLSLKFTSRPQFNVSGSGEKDEESAGSLTNTTKTINTDTITTISRDETTKLDANVTDPDRELVGFGRNLKPRSQAHGNIRL